MGGGKPPSPMGSMMNQQFAQQMTARRDEKKQLLSQQEDELFATLLKSGQSPYRSPYEPQATGFPNLFDTDQFG